MASPHLPANPHGETAERHLRPVHTAGTNTRTGTGTAAGTDPGEGVREPVHESAREPDPAGPPVTELVRPIPATNGRVRATFWTWEGRMPAGSLVIGPGREGIGKSLFCAWLTAQITRGELPGVHFGTPKGVFYVATEDSWERTVLGRLMVAGADLSRVFRIEVDNLVTGSRVPLSLPRHCDALAHEIAAHDVALLVLDPLISAVDQRIDVNGDQGLRTALEPLAALADRTECLVFGLAHFNKATGTDVLSRITGSRAFAAVARAVVAFARDHHADDGTCVMSQAKNNLGRLDLPSLRYIVDTETLHTDDGDAQFGRLRMIGETDTHVDDLINDTGPEPGRAEGKAARAWLLDHLGQAGGAALCNDVIAAAEQAGYSSDQLKHAKKWLTRNRQVGSKRIGTVWWWHLPDTEPTEPGGNAVTSQEGKGATLFDTPTSEEGKP